MTFIIVVKPWLIVACRLGGGGQVAGVEESDGRGERQVEQEEDEVPGPGH